MTWLEKTQAEIAGSVGDDAAAYGLSKRDIEELLELAGVAAHESGARTNAPLTAYLVGLARGRHPDQSLSDLVQVVIGKPA
jgi:Domain of unknown function (DUF6457)